MLDSINLIESDENSAETEITEATINATFNELSKASEENKKREIDKTNGLITRLKEMGISFRVKKSSPDSLSDSEALDLSAHRADNLPTSSVRHDPIPTEPPPTLLLIQATDQKEQTKRNENTQAATPVTPAFNKSKAKNPYYDGPAFNTRSRKMMVTRSQAKKTAQKSGTMATSSKKYKR